MKEYVCADGRMSVNGICSVSNITKDYSKDVKSNFEWNFDKVGDKVEDFNQTMKDGITSFDSYIQDNLGIKNMAKNAAIGLALGPMAVPYFLGKNVFNQYQNNIITDKTMKDTQGDIVTYDMMTYGNPNIDYGQGGASQQTQSSYEDNSGSYTGMGEAINWGGGE